ncbi:LPS assembly protein LptD, partial [Alphaproteobacteria bacterium]|nr:LPS assembly protein LptD [Alphaproteobacteria bacterium]
SSNITYNEKENIVELAENSKINFKNTNILIDKGIIDYDKNEFEVFGNFYLYEDLTILSGQDLKGNTSLDIFSANNVNYIYNDDLKIDSDNLNRENNLLYFYNNFLTPCELEGYFNCPTWSLRIDKTEYNIEEDKFTHFDTFLQIADYKVFYLPYFSHYGTKAPRKKGFLTPTIQFTIGGNQGVVTPYYLPISQNTDILFKPTITLNQNFEFLETFQLSTIIKNKGSGGDTSISIDNMKNENSEDINTTMNINTKQVINKNIIFSASGLFTNSISTTRSNNEEPLTFEDIYLRIENYNIIGENDFLKTELSTVESFEATNLSSIPIVPNLKYTNFVDFKDYSIINDLDFAILKRDESTIENPSESFKIKLSNEIFDYQIYKDVIFQNKLSIDNSYNDYYFNKDQSLNHHSFKSTAILSSDLQFSKIGITNPKIKFIIPTQLEDNNKSINENSKSITFNYQNQFSDNRFFGSDLFDSSPRIVYGIENYFNTKNTEISLNINQSLDANLNNNYAYLINQNSRLSDYSVESKLKINEILFKIDTRLDNDNLSKKEMNYELSFDKFLNTSLIYNETQSEAYRNLSADTQSIIMNISKKINDNVNINFNSNLDVKNNYDPYKSTVQLSLFDDCSQLNIGYSNTRFNDNFNTQPEEKISLTFIMDYLGFFGYEQSTDLFFKEPGNMNYGL